MLVLIIAIQKSKGSLGSSRFSGGTALFFGGSSGQDLFQKTTWILGALFMITTLVLALMKSDYSYRIMQKNIVNSQR